MKGKGKKVEENARKEERTAKCYNGSAEEDKKGRTILRARGKVGWIRGDSQGGGSPGGGTVGSLEGRARGEGAGGGGKRLGESEGGEWGKESGEG